MSKSRLLVYLLFAAVFSSLSYAATPDRITGDLTSGPKVQVAGNVHGLARPQNDLGRADGSRMIEGLSLQFRRSPAQQKDMDQFLAQLADRSSPNFHKYLKIPQYAARFGVSQNDLDKIVSWLQSQGFTNIRIAPTHHQVSFDGTVAQIESTFAPEMHNYLVNGVVHLANSASPSIPAALSGIVMYIGHLNDFAPRPRLKVQPHFTSYISGNHFLTPGDFATIYDLNDLYSTGITGSGQKIAIVGQSTVNPSDLSNFRTAAGLSPNAATLTLIEGTGTRCSGDEGESDLDLEWSGGVAQNASIIFLYAGLGSGDSCEARADSVWDSIEDALTGTLTGVNGSPVAPFVSTSYGYCEAGLGAAFAGGSAQNGGLPGTLEGWIQTGQTLGVTLTSASGDAGAADCDTTSESSATEGLAVDAPASIPETTGAGGNEFYKDTATCNTDCPPGGDSPYWAPAGTTTDTISSALEYISEEAWNDTAENGALSASGGGVSTYFTTTPSWQNVTGVPSPGTGRYVPDISFTASADHDPYLFCSEDDPETGGTQATCTDGFRTGAGGDLTAVGGTSAAAPTFTAVMALVNQYLGNTPPTGLAPINPMLYSLYPSNLTSGAFNDVTTGSNMVPCIVGTTDCPTGTTEIGYNAGVGYDEVTGLGSVNGFHLAEAWSATLTAYTFVLNASTAGGTLSVQQGQTTGAVNMTITSSSTPSFVESSGTGQETAMPVTYTCSGLPSESTCFFNGTANTLTSQLTAVTLTIQTTAPTTKLLRPFDRGTGILYALLLPGLLGIVFTVGSRKRALGGMRLLGLILVLGFSTLWLGSCGGSSTSSNKNPGTPVGSSSVTVNATTRGGPSATLQFTLSVTAASSH